MSTDTNSPKRTRSDKAYDLVVDRIMQGHWHPGEQLNIPTLAREFDISQTPIREALARLEFTGLVRREALRGYFVAPPLTEPDVRKLMAARLVLEPAIAREAARRVTPEFLAALATTIDAPPAGGRDEDGPTPADEQFHALIADQAANPFLAAAVGSLDGQVQRLRAQVSPGTDAAADAADERRAVYAALERRDPEAAETAMARHLRRAQERALAKTDG